MSFWHFTHARPQAVALIDEQGRTVRYAELDAEVDQAVRELDQAGAGALGLLFAANHRKVLVAYLACLRSKRVALLLPQDMPADLVQALVAQYEPDWLLGQQRAASPASDVLPPLVHGAGGASRPAPHPDLGLLLSTSGTTGSPRLVRLSRQALQANAESIAGFLQLAQADRAITSLPPHYSYGLSVINSHLHAGASLVLTDLSVMSRQFWETLDTHAATSLAGVPYVYQMLHRMGFAKMPLPSLRTITQAGGKLDDRLTKAFADLAASRAWRFFVMYGQTEATARISYVPPERLPDKIGSIGIAIPGGELSIDPQSSELVYRGPNVMMGYAESRADLGRGDDLQGVLRTGDLGRCDDDGFFYVTGRLKRFVKLTGNRIGLDEVEQMLQQELGAAVAVTGRDECLVALIEGEDGGLIERAQALLKQKYALHHSLYRLRCVAALPLLPSGKKDYGAALAAI